MANITGDGRIGDLARAYGAALNVVQCSGSTMAQSLYDVADHFEDPEMLEKNMKLVKEELARVVP